MGGALPSDAQEAIRQASSLLSLNALEALAKSLGNGASETFSGQCGEFMN
jgi:hypothetical protein